MSAWGKSFGLAFGLAFGAVALQPVEPPIQQAVEQVQQGTGGGSSDGGTGWVKKDHGWVKLIKHAVSGAKAKDIETLQRGAAEFGIGRGQSRAFDLSGGASSNLQGSMAHAVTHAHNLISSSFTTLDMPSLRINAAVHNQTAEWLAYDELIAIIDMADMG